MNNHGFNGESLYVLPDSEKGDNSLKICIDFDATSPQPKFKRNDYVLISQSEQHQWVGQIADVERIISPMGQYSDNTIEYLRRQVLSPDTVRPLRVVRLFEIRIIGQYFDNQLDVPLNNILPGAIVSKLDEERIRNLINTPRLKTYQDNSQNVVGIIQNAENIPLTIDSLIIRDHIGVGGASGQGK
ncbi:MAG: ATP-binding protein, partial [Microcystis aeruginosa]